jgi:hypothetical protein
MLTLAFDQGLFAAAVADSVMPMEAFARCAKR